MCQKGHAAEDIRIPERDGVVSVYFIIQELLHTKVKSNEVRRKKGVPTNDDIFEKKKTESP